MCTGFECMRVHYCVAWAEQLLSTMIKTDLKNAVNLRRASAPNIRSPRHYSLSDPMSYPQVMAPNGPIIPIVFTGFTFLVCTDDSRPTYLLLKPP